MKDFFREFLFGRQFLFTIRGIIAEQSRASVLDHGQGPVFKSRSNKVEAILSASTRGNKYPQRHIIHMSIMYKLNIGIVTISGIQT